MNYTYNIAHKKHISMKKQTGSKSTSNLWNYGEKVNIWIPSD